MTPSSSDDAPGPGATAEELIAYADKLEAEGRLVDNRSMREKQADAPGSRGPYFEESSDQDG